MRLRLAHRLLGALIALGVATPLASGDDVVSGPPAGVRGASLDAVHLLEELVARSSTGRDLLEQLSRSDLVIFVRHAWFPIEMLRGRIGFLASRSRGRLFAIEISSRQTRTEQLVALGHELQHAVEIAGAASVHDARTLAAFYTGIGELSGQPGSATCETAAAIATARRVRQELLAPSVSADPALRRHH